MRILLLGEYSNLHATLSTALRRAGHTVLLVSDGDGWKNYPRDIDLRRRCAGPWGSLRYLSHLVTLLPRFRGYDVVQLINPVFLDVKPRWNRWVFDYLQRHNRLVSVGCFGDDYYVLHHTQDPSLFLYSDLQAYGRPIHHELNDRRLHTWLHTPKAALTQHIMSRAACLIPCLYEYYKVYIHTPLKSKVHYIPLPILQAPNSSNPSSLTPNPSPLPLPPSSFPLPPSPVHLLLAVQRTRGLMKGTDQLAPLLERLAANHPDVIQLTRIESVPFAEYQRLVAQADVVVDQLYSYTPAMAALQSLSQCKVVISGYEAEYARFLSETEASASIYSGEADAFTLALQTGIINLRPYADEANYRLLEQLLTHPQHVRTMQQAAVAYVQRHHDAQRVAQRYLEVWSSASGVGVESSSSSRSSHR